MVTKAKECALCPATSPAVSLIFASFAGDRDAIEIPVCKYHSNLAHALLDPAMGVRGKKKDKNVLVSAPKKRGRPAKKAAVARRTSTGAPNLSDVREWAWSAGYEVGERGRIPADVIDAFKKAQKK